MANVIWPLVPTKSTTWGSVTLAGTPANQCSMLEGVDGGVEGVWKSHPGHHRMGDSGKTLATVDESYTHTEFDIDVCEPWEVQTGTGAQVMLRGMLVGNSDTGEYELWFRKDGDAEGTWRKQDLASYRDSILGITPGAGTVVPTLSYDDIFGDDYPDCVVPFEELWGTGTTYRSQIKGIALYDDGTGNGVEVYIAGEHIGKGGSTWLGHAGFVAKVTRNGTLQRIGGGLFDGAVHGLAVACGRLWVYGGFTTAGDRNLQGIGWWDGEKWAEVEQGMTTGVVRDVFPHNDLDATSLFIVGTFSEVTDSAGSPITSTYNVKINGTSTTAPTWAVCNTLGGALTSDGAYRIIRVPGNGGAYPDFAVCGGFDQAASQPGIAYIASGNPASVVWVTLGIDWMTADEAGAFTGLCYLVNINGPWMVAVGRSATKFRVVDVSYPCIEDEVTSRYNVAINYQPWGIYSLTGETTPSDTAYVCGENGDATYTNLMAYKVSAGPSWAFTSVLDTDYIADTTSTTYRTTKIIEVTGENSPADCKWALLGRWHGPEDRPFKENGGRVSVVGWDRYLYLLGDDGHHRVLSWDDDADAFTSVPFGPGPLELPAPDSADQVAATGVIQPGRVTVQYRLYDPDRKRWSGLSQLPVADVGVTNAARYIQVSNCLWGSNTRVTTDNLDYVQLYRSLSTLDVNLPAGGYMYRVGTYRHNGKGGFTWATGYTENGYLVYSDSDPSISDALTDGVLPMDPDRKYDIDREQVGELGECCAAVQYQGCLVAVENWGGRLWLRWSNPWREEPENFPVVNAFPLDVPATLGGTARFVDAGDFLLLVVGSTIARIQKSGAVFQAWRLGNITQVCGPNAVVKGPGASVFVATQGGLMEVNGATGRITQIPDANTLFTERWKQHLEDDGEISLAWDSLLNCVYIHNGALAETGLLWIGTGRCTLLKFHGASLVVGGPRFDDGTTPVMYGIWPGRFVTHPNWHRTNDIAIAMGGSPYHSDTWPLTVGVTVGADGSGDPRRLTWPSGSPFLVGGSGSDALTVAGLHVAVLDSAGTVRVRRCEGAGAAYLDVDGDLTLGAAVVAVSPIMFGVASAPLWHPKGYSDLYHRKTLSSMGLVVMNRERGPGPRATEAPWEIRGGGFRVSQYMATLPVTDDTSELFPFRALGVVSVVTGEAPDKDRVVSTVDGVALVAAWEMILTNEIVDVGYCECKGQVQDSIVAGQTSS